MAGGLSAPMEPASHAIPHFAVELAAPDISWWLPGNTGVRGFTTFDAGRPGPHIALIAVLHGNEIAGAVVLDRLMRRGIVPARGKLTLGFANIAAFSRFDPAQPTASRFLDEDMNRVWDPAVLDGPRSSAELRRARALRPVLDAADVVLDLHSMLWPADPLFLVGGSPDSLELALRVGEPPLVVADAGHEAGRRMIEYGPFGVPRSGRRGLLLEAGWHWEEATAALMERAARRLLAVTGLLPSPARGTTSMVLGVEVSTPKRSDLK